MIIDVAWKILLIKVKCFQECAIIVNQSDIYCADHTYFSYVLLKLFLIHFDTVEDLLYVIISLIALWFCQKSPWDFHFKLYRKHCLGNYGNPFGDSEYLLKILPETYRGFLQKFLGMSSGNTSKIIILTHLIIFQKSFNSSSVIPLVTSLYIVP